MKFKFNIKKITFTILIVTFIYYLVNELIYKSKSRRELAIKEGQIVTIPLHNNQNEK